MAGLQTKMKTENKYVEQRRTARRRGYMQASIVHPLQTENLNCVVRDVSQDGALIDFPNPASLPSPFWLRIEGDARLSLCSVARLSERQLGVEFSEQIKERLERLRVERWAQSRLNWSGLATQKLHTSANIGNCRAIKQSSAIAGPETDCLSVS